MEKKKTDDLFIVLATSSLTEDKTFVLKHDDSFAILNRYGDIIPFEKSVQGIYHDGTRFLSELQLRINGKKPLILSSDLKEGNEMFSADLTNPDIMTSDTLKLEKGTVHIMRKKVLWEAVYYEQILLFNYGLDDIDFGIDLLFDADFSDIFEIRGMVRLNKGDILPSKSDNNSLKMSYIGLDGIERSTNIFLSPDPQEILKNAIHYEVRLAPARTFFISVSVSFSTGVEKENTILGFQSAAKKQKRRLDFINSTSVDIITSNQQFNHWINRSKADLITMITQTSDGPYPYAGIPWYNTPFGRDAVITALECMWMSPEVAKGVLKFLARTQARSEDTFRDAEPGKILHEARKGEMAALDEIPFRQYYGSIDSTPLFIVLAGEYYKRTGDLSTIKELWPNIMLALQWIEKYGDIDNDLFVEYSRKEKSGLFNQGWKDSHDSVSYRDGNIAEPPIALCEVQGYVYDALINAFQLSQVMGMKEEAGKLMRRAEAIRQKFNETFWFDEKSTFYLALAGNKKPCNIVASNPGHCLFSGIATMEHARDVAKSLLSGNMFTGWGIRTLSSEELRYNPMSYHNGSVWPHDNALIAFGLSRYGLKEEVKTIAAGLFDASLHMDGQRLPELFCGFRRRPGEGPTAYPVACSPQAWSVASVFMVVQALLGLEIDEPGEIIRFYRPVLPAFIDWLEIKNLKFKNQHINIECVKTTENVNIGLLNKDNSVRLEINY